MQRFNENKFWAFVEYGEDCWLWQGAVMKSGYGTFGGGQNKQLTHRLSWSIINGEIPKDTMICHTCDNPTCVNPNHLFPGTQQDNMQDAKRKLRIPYGGRHHTKLYPENIPRGEKRAMAKLNPEKVKKIRELYSFGNTSTYKLAKEFDVSQGLIWQVVSRTRNWTHV